MLSEIGEVKTIKQRKSQIKARIVQSFARRRPKPRGGKRKNQEGDDETNIWLSNQPSDNEKNNRVKNQTRGVTQQQGKSYTDRCISEAVSVMISKPQKFDKEATTHYYVQYKETFKCSLIRCLIHISSLISHPRTKPVQAPRAGNNYDTLTEVLKKETSLFRRRRHLLLLLFVIPWIKNIKEKELSRSQKMQIQLTYP